MLGAAGLLADARPQVICWNGSKGRLVGFDRDRLLCERITERHGVPAVTSTLALEEVLRREGLERIGFVTPYAEATNQRVMTTWTAQGFTCLPVIAAGLTDNFSYSTLPEDGLRAMARLAADQKPDVIVFYCTNMNGAPLCADLESELGLPVLDSVSIGVWKSLAILERSLPNNRWGHLLG
jgi:maleate isomerase